jgi:hypothetical protein
MGFYLLMIGVAWLAGALCYFLFILKKRTVAEKDKVLDKESQVGAQRPVIEYSHESSVLMDLINQDLAGSIKPTGLKVPLHQPVAVVSLTTTAVQISGSGQGVDTGDDPEILDLDGVEVDFEKVSDSARQQAQQDLTSVTEALPIGTADLSHLLTDVL